MGLSSAPAAGGPTRVYKTADETVNSSNVYQDDDELSGVALAANTVYAIRLVVRHSGTVVADHKLQLALPAGATWLTEADYRCTASSSAWHPSVGSAAIAFSTEWTFSPIGASDESVMNITGYVIVAGTAGNLDVQWAQNTAEASDTKVLEGSYLEYQEAA